MGLSLDHISPLWQITIVPPSCCPTFWWFSVCEVEGERQITVVALFCFPHAHAALRFVGVLFDLVGLHQVKQ